MRSEVSVIVLVDITVLRDVTPQSLVGMCLWFEEPAASIVRAEEETAQ